MNRWIPSKRNFLSDSFARLPALMLCVALALSVNAQAQEANNGASNSPVKSRPKTQLQYTKWSGDLNVPDPVSISFDNKGRAFVTQTQRRKAQDLDIREHRQWISNDLSFQSVEDKRNFYKSTMRLSVNAEPGESNSQHVADHNKDGKHDFRDLMVLSENIHLVQDTDNDGTADKINLWAEDFKTEITGIGAGVLAYDGDVYATVAPDVWKLRDSNGDGTADQREVMATGFGLHIAYAGHDMHGLTVGPDGKIYWSVGDKGISATSKTGRRFHYPNQGGVMRCNPDGSDFEVFAHGLRNVQELAFDQYGNLFGFDNDSDQPNEKERFIHIVEGMDAGWRCNYQYRGNDYNPWMKERMWEPLSSETAADQPLHIIPPISNSVDGPCGFAFNPGTALTADYRDYFFLTSTLGGEQLSFKIEPDGGSYKVVNQHQIGKGIPMIGINFGPDGGLYGVDWAGGYPLNQKGNIWKIDGSAGDLDDAQTKLRARTAELLQLDFSEIDEPELTELLGFADQRVRFKSQFELAKRNKIVPLFRIASQGGKALPRIHAIWALGQIARKGNEGVRQMLGAVANNEARNLLKKKNNGERLAFAKVQVVVNLLRTASDNSPSSTTEDEPFAAYYLQLTGIHPHIDQQIAIALSKYRTQPQPETRLEIQSLFTMANASKPNDTYLRHAISMAAANLEYSRIRKARATNASTPIVSPLLESFGDANKFGDDQPEATRLHSILAIRKLASLLNNDSLQLIINLENYLASPNEDIATAAARAIHDDFSITSALPQLASRLNISQVSKEAFLRRALNANYRLGDAASLNRTVAFATENLNNDLGLEAIYSIKTWANPDVLDRVTGRHRGIQTERMFDKEMVKPALLAALKSAIELGSDSLKANRLHPAVALIDTLRHLEIEIPKAELLKIYDSQLPGEVRAEALASLAKQTDAQTTEPEIRKAFTSSLKSKSKPVRIAGLKIAVGNSPAAAIEHIRTLLLPNSKTPVDEKQNAVTQLAKISSGPADQLLSSLLCRIRESELDGRILLEVLGAGEAKRNSSAIINANMSDIEANRLAIANANSIKKLDKELSEYFECLDGGNSKLGKAIFNTNIDAQCSRCHRVTQKGSNVGPELSNVALREPAKSDPHYLLQSIVAPSAKIAEKYQTIMFLLESGQTVKGVVVREDKETTVIADETGKEIVINNDEIEDESKQKVSIMPVAKSLTKRDIRDLVAYLKTLKKNKKKK